MRGVGGVSVQSNEIILTHLYESSRGCVLFNLIDFID